MQKPALTDTEAESSMDMDASVTSLNRVSQANATKSIFNITLDNALEEQRSLEIKNYESRLHWEIKQWSALWRVSLQKLKDFKQHQHSVIDKTILSSDKLDYLNKAPDLQRFLRDSTEFQKLMHVVLEKDYAELQEAQQNLIAVCEHIAMVVKARKIAQNLANK